jgi:hypothetical protein
VTELSVIKGGGALSPFLHTGERGQQALPEQVGWASNIRECDRFLTSFERGGKSMPVACGEIFEENRDER